MQTAFKQNAKLGSSRSVRGAPLVGKATTGRKVSRSAMNIRAEKVRVLPIPASRFDFRAPHYQHLLMRNIAHQRWRSNPVLDAS